MAVSASQVSKYRACPRQWAFAWQDPVREPQGEAAAFGERIHEVARAYHAEGKAPERGTPEGDVFLVALPHVPAPLTGTAEGEFRQVIDGIEYHGYVDLEWVGNGIPHVLDYKTVRNFRFAFDGPGDFLNDPQAMLYARRALAKYPNAPGVVLTWLYLKREGRAKALPVTVTLTWAEIMDAFERVVVPRAKTLVQLKARKPNPRALDANTEQCYRYGVKNACKYLVPCGVKNSDRLANLMEDGMSGDLLAELESKFAGINPPENKAATVSAPVAAPPAVARPAQLDLPMQQTSPAPSMAEVGTAVMTLIRLFKSL